MSISLTASSNNQNQGLVKGLAHQRREDFQSLTSAVQAGDIEGAQLNLAKLEPDAKAHGVGNQHRPGTAPAAINANMNSANVSAMAAYVAMMAAPVAASVSVQA